jgi:gluconolactonase
MKGNKMKRNLKIIGVIFMMIQLNNISFGQQSVTAPGAVVEKLAGDFSFTEGPAADAQGNVYFTDQPNNKILKWSIDGKLSTFMENAGRSNGLYFDNDGNILACADANNQLWQIDAKGNVTILVKDYEGKLLNGPNDLWKHPSGGIYFSDPLFARSYWTRTATSQQDGEHIYYLSPDRKKLIRVTTDIVKPNGLIGTADGKTLYITDTGSRQTFSYTVNDDGTLSNKKPFAPESSDGMTIDNRGNVYLTTSGIAVYDPNGKKIETINVPERPSNVTFGGKDRSTLFITARTSLYSIRMQVKGIEPKPSSSVPGLEEDTFKTNAGELKIIFVGHGTLMFDFAGKIIHVDPVGSSKADYSKMPKADIILITHEHGDHLNPATIEIIRKPTTQILVNQSSSSVTGSIVMKNGDVKTIDGLKIEAVPAYNLAAAFHQKGNGNGYVITFGDKRVYVAGDTDNVPEMQQLKDIDIAFLPISPTYAMTSTAMVVEAVTVIKPKIFYPYHYLRTDTSEIVNLLKDSKDIEVRIRQMQ